jgi:hypothetical protein
VGIRAASVIAVIVLSLGITACTGAGKPTAGGTTSASPTATGPFSGTARAPGSATATATASATGTATASPSASASATHSATPSPTPAPTTSSPYPTSAPITGGGGTAGLQDTGLLAIGIACVVAGAGAFVWRRRLTHRG